MTHVPLQQSSARTEGYDAGLRAYLLKVYNYMTGALALTGAAAFFSARSEPFLNAMYVMQGHAIIGTKPLAWVVLFAPLILILIFSAGILRMSAAAAQAVFWAYAALIGLSFSSLFLIFTGESIARVFFITAGMFAGMSLYGYTTQRDLTGVGNFLIMGLIGVIIASLVNLFMRSPGLFFATSLLGVIIFTGLTAYDTQRLKTLYHLLGGPHGERAAIMGALTLYLDFINIFLSLLNLFGERK